MGQPTKIRVIITMVSTFVTMCRFVFTGFVFPFRVCYNTSFVIYVLTYPFIQHRTLHYGGIYYPCGG